MNIKAIAAGALLAVAAAGVAHASVNLLANGSFESPNLGTGNYTYPGGLLDSWTYGGSALVNASGASAWYGAAPPAGQDGDQFAALQGASTLSQTFTLATAGSDLLTWTEAGRPFFGCCNGDQTYEVLVDSVVLGTYSTVSGQAFTPEGLAVSLGAGSHTLTFQGLIATDETSFLDDVSLSAVPEPAAWALMLLGFAGLGAGVRARRGVAAAAA